jgi:putative addiction module component (TIGR02574 family)
MAAGRRPFGILVRGLAAENAIDLRTLSLSVVLGILLDMSTLTSEDIARLSPSERLALIGDLWNSLSDAQSPATSAQLAEIGRRLESFEQDCVAAVTWEQLRSELHRRVS